MLKTTTSTVDGKEVEAYLDIVVGEAILGANIFKDILGSIRDVIGGRSGAYEEEMGNARTIALAEMESHARALGADGIIGVDIDYEVVGQGGSMMMVSVSGTAVRFKKR
ncbi:heavy metal-binding domain-containing protein [Photobacterium japonica]|uniref:heavy metal-binding domain-containing protein n=1 Tax=Photobacterium japonica TaxID=2910235 RepID=UPI003D096A53